MVAVMALDLHIARLARILVDSEGITFDEAQDRLRALTLEIVVGSDATTPAAHAAILTAVSVGHRTFVGGVRVVGAIDQPLNSALPIAASSLKDAVAQVGGTVFDTPASRKIVIGSINEPINGWSVGTWWDDWCAGTDEPGARLRANGDNPLAGIAAGALAVGAAFDAERGVATSTYSVVDLWPTSTDDSKAPDFAEVFLPGAIWLIGLGNLGQAFLWTLSALPYSEPHNVSLVLQDQDRISAENWSTSVLVRDGNFGVLKTRASEDWALEKGFKVRRIDRRLVATDRLADDDPRVALSGLDKYMPRKELAKVGFDCIVDAGLGNTAASFDRYRVTVFDNNRRIDAHFSDKEDPINDDAIPDKDAYKRLEEEIGRCGTAEVAGAAVAAPYVSAVTAAIAISRLIASTSGCDCSPSEVGRLSSSRPARIASPVKIDARGISHSGRPKLSEK